MDESLPAFRQARQDDPSRGSSETGLRCPTDAAGSTDRLRQRRPSQDRTLQSHPRTNRPLRSLHGHRSQTPSHLETGESPFPDDEAFQHRGAGDGRETDYSKDFKDLWREISTTTTKGQTYGLTSTTDTVTFSFDLTGRSWGISDSGPEIPRRHPGGS